MRKRRTTVNVEELFAPCEAFADEGILEYTEAEEDEAKKALISFFQTFRGLTPTEYFVPGSYGYGTRPANYYDFMFLLDGIQGNLSRGKYRYACAGLGTLIHFYNALENRIYTALVTLYERYLKQ